MKVLHSQIITGIAGSEKYLLNALPRLKKSGVDIHFLSLYKPNEHDGMLEFNTILESHDITVHAAPVGRFPSYRSISKIRVLINEENYDLVHSHLLHADFTISLVKRLSSNKFNLVSTKHGYEEAYNNKHGFDPSHKKNNRYYLTAKFAEQQMNRSFAISSGLYNLYSGLGICDKTKLDLIHYGFDFPDQPQDNISLRMSPHQLVLVGRLTGFKGHRYAFEAVKILKEKYADLKLVVVGNGELEQELKLLVKQLGIEDHVVFTGFQPNATEYMYNSDIVLLPSISEGFGVVVLEAMSVKKPLVTFDVPSPNEILQQGETGVLVPPYDTVAYANAIDTLLSSKEQRDNIALNAYQKLKGYYNTQRMVDETIEFYKRVIKE